ncbi:hypothetical protein Tco_0349470 [Tanacetum coccineum]
MEDFYRPSIIGRGGPIAPTIVPVIPHCLLSDSDESDEDEPSEVLDIQKPIHSLSGNPTSSSDFVKSSGSTTSHSDLSLLEYESFHFDLSIDQLPLADRSDFYDKGVSRMNSLTSFSYEYDHFLLDLRTIQESRLDF